MRHMRRFGSILIVLLIVAGVGAVLAAGGGKTSSSSASATAAAPKLWHCGMHPQVIQDHPANCPICGMGLTPIEASGDSSQPLVVTIEPEIVQNMGVRTAVVKRG